MNQDLAVFIVPFALVIGGSLLALGGLYFINIRYVSSAPRAMAALVAGAVIIGILEIILYGSAVAFFKAQQVQTSACELVGEFRPSRGATRRRSHGHPRGDHRLHERGGIRMGRQAQALQGCADRDESFLLSTDRFNGPDDHKYSVELRIALAGQPELSPRHGVRLTLAPRAWTTDLRTPPHPSTRRSNPP